MLSRLFFFLTGPAQPLTQALTPSPAKTKTQAHTAPTLQTFRVQPPAPAKVKVHAQTVTLVPGRTMVRPTPARAATDAQAVSLRPLNRITPTTAAKVKVHSQAVTLVPGRVILRPAPPARVTTHAPSVQLVRTNRIAPAATARVATKAIAGTVRAGHVLLQPSAARVKASARTVTVRLVNRLAPTGTARVAVRSTGAMLRLPNRIAPTTTAHVAVTARSVTLVPGRVTLRPSVTSRVSVRARAVTLRVQCVATPASAAHTATHGNAMTRLLGAVRVQPTPARAKTHATAGPVFLRHVVQPTPARVKVHANSAPRVAGRVILLITAPGRVKTQAKTVTLQVQFVTRPSPARVSVRGRSVTYTLRRSVPLAQAAHVQAHANTPAVSAGGTRIVQPTPARLKSAARSVTLVPGVSIRQVTAPARGKVSARAVTLRNLSVLSPAAAHVRVAGRSVRLVLVRVVLSGTTRSAVRARAVQRVGRFQITPTVLARTAVHANAAPRIAGRVIYAAVTMPRVKTTARSATLSLVRLVTPSPGRVQTRARAATPIPGRRIVVMTQTAHAKTHTNTPLILSGGTRTVQPAPVAVTVHGNAVTRTMGVRLVVAGRAVLSTHLVTPHVQATNRLTPTLGRSASTAHSVTHTHHRVLRPSAKTVPVRAQLGLVVPQAVYYADFGYWAIGYSDGIAKTVPPAPLAARAQPVTSRGGIPFKQPPPVPIAAHAPVPTIVRGTARVTPSPARAGAQTRVQAVGYAFHLHPPPAHVCTQAGGAAHVTRSAIVRPSLPHVMTGAHRGAANQTPAAQIVFLSASTHVQTLAHPVTLGNTSAQFPLSGHLHTVLSLYCTRTFSVTLRG